MLCIVNLKDDFGKINWTEVSNQMIDRNPRQCRERYKHYLLPDLSKADWSQEEDQRLLYEVEISGKKWTEISKSFAGRTSIGLKNRYSLLLRRKKAIMYGKKNIAEKKVDIIKSTPLPDQDYIAMDFFKDNDVENNVEGAFVDDFDWEI